jgi:altronate hydrolase
MNRFVVLNANDDVALALVNLSSGERLAEVELISDIPAGHKFSLRELSEGEPVRKYGQIIGKAKSIILSGQHVHLDNLEMVDGLRDNNFTYAEPDTQNKLSSESFMGYPRESGAVGTRNYIGIISTVNCSVTVVEKISNYFTYGDGKHLFNDLSGIDGIVPIKHGLGCAMSSKGEGFEILQRTISGYIHQPNFCSVLLIGLGCEVNNIESLSIDSSNNNIETLEIQNAGGTSKAVEEGIKLVKEMIEKNYDTKRTLVDAKHLMLSLQCGGSDGYSGITANPVLGKAVDLLVSYGGTAVLGETPEIYGAEHLLYARTNSEDVMKKLQNIISWWESYVQRYGGSMDNNPSPGNKDGGLTTILEKSLGAVAKSGQSNLIEVYKYAEHVDKAGFVFMDTPGYDPVSVTGHIAGGCNIVCFTTGRGAAFGSLPSPTVKVSSNSQLYQTQSDDIDLNAGALLDGSQNLDELGRVLFELIIRVASGEKTKSELNGYGYNEFLPWQMGAVM